MLSEEIEANYSQELAERARNPFHSYAPNGESLREVAERGLMAIDEIVNKHRDESILIVSPGTSLTVIGCHANGFRMKDVYQRIRDNAHLSP
jgi:broad specificity phosphatase PhoE